MLVLALSACSTRVVPAGSEPGLAAQSIAPAPAPGVAATPSEPTTAPPRASATAAATTAATAVATPTAGETPGPQAIVQSFYDWWVAPEFDGDNDFTKRPELAPAFAKATRDYMHQPFSIEPFLCVQDGPVERVAAAEAVIDGSSATVIITFTLAGENHRQVELVRGSAGWQITAVRCDLL